MLSMCHLVLSCLVLSCLEVSLFCFVFVPQAGMKLVRGLCINVWLGACIFLTSGRVLEPHNLFGCLQDFGEGQELDRALAFHCCCSCGRIASPCFRHSTYLLRLFRRFLAVFRLVGHGLHTPVFDAQGSCCFVTLVGGSTFLHRRPLPCKVSWRGGWYKESRRAMREQGCSGRLPSAGH